MYFFNTSKVRVFTSIIGFTFISVCFFLMCRYRFPVGDDVLCQFEDTIYFYLDDMDNAQVEFVQIDSLSQIFNYLRQMYFLWTGRIFEPIMQPALGMLGRNFTAIFTVIIYMGSVLLGGRLICNNIRTVFDHPCMVIVLSSLMCLYNNALGMLIMWTMSIIYGYSLFMYLLMMNITKDLVYDNKKYNVFLINLVGFMTGISHELIGCWFILQIMFIILMKTKFKNLMDYIKFYLGLIIGYCICFFAPGNFNRLHQKHDAGVWNPYYDKLLAALRVHLKILTNYEGIGFIIFLFIIISAILALGTIMKMHNSGWAFKLQLFFIINILTSIFLWAIVSYTPEYGVIGALCYFVLTFFVLINEIDKSKAFTIIAVIVLFCISVDNAVFMNQFVRESQERESRVADAIKNNENEVYIGAYSSNLNRNFLMKEYVDSSEQYSRPYYIKYYGIKIVIDEN